MKPDIQIKKRYNQPIHKVWKQLTTQEALSTWLMPTEDFELMVSHEFHFKGKSSLGFDDIIECYIIDVDPPLRLIYTWNSHRLKEPTLLTWSLKEVPGGTSVLLEQTGFKGFRGKLAKFFLKIKWNRLMKKMMI